MPKGNRSFALGVKHDQLLQQLAEDSGRTLTETIRRALDALKEKHDRAAELTDR